MLSDSLLRRRPCAGLQQRRWTSLSDTFILGTFMSVLSVQNELQEEVKDMAKKMGSAGMQLLVIDTENKFVSTGFAEEIAKAGLGKYYYLPNASDASIAAAASGAMAAAKAGY